MSANSTYETLRHFADSWGLLIMLVAFLALAAWPFRPGGKARSKEATEAIFKDDTNGE